MASTIREHGNMLLLTLEGVGQFTAFPTQGGLWILNTSAGGGPTNPPPAGAWVLPVAPEFDVNRPNGDFGPRDIAGGSSNHMGVDFNGSGMNNAPIYAASAGTVNRVNAFSAFGNGVGITHGDGSDTFYAHMIAQPLVSVGDVVTAGQIIGNVGSTGQSTGDHLHFETRETVGGSPVDPEPFMLARGVVIPVG